MVQFSIETKTIRCGFSYFDNLPITFFSLVEFHRTGLGMFFHLVPLHSLIRRIFS